MRAHRDLLQAKLYGIGFDDDKEIRHFLSDGTQPSGRERTPPGRGDAYDGQLHNANFSEFEKTLLQSGRKFHARRNPIGCMGVTLDGRRRVCAGDAGLPADEFEEKVFAV